MGGDLSNLLVEKLAVTGWQPALSVGMSPITIYGLPIYLCDLSLDHYAVNRSKKAANIIAFLSLRAGKFQHINADL